ncbi:hypothetical protein H6P81_020765 [Aristolochia fimbriata]|uniref:Uncharacterized protein n=1 Tax=Aristolochia fimbriata TaxID=158543 RepID=A0AAV7DVA9_ARIFI|nr:hypothetical protein H6P81_020765 [Aristolochia fimbriata]
MENYLRKLAIWHTKTFRPIMTHEELEPIMSTLGFVALPETTVSGIQWKEYAFPSAGCLKPGAVDPPPRARLPYPRIDALHLYTYRAFFDALTHFLRNRDIADYFHVRGMPLQRAHDREFEKQFRPMNDGEGVYVYRDGTLDKATLTASTGKSSDNSSNSSKSNSAATPICIVFLKDIIVT